MSKVSVVVPVFKSRDSLPELVRRLILVLSPDDEVVLVDDGSEDGTWEVIAQLATPQVTGVRLAKNCGQHAALLAGIRVARNEVVVTIDDDLQNPPEEIPILLQRLDESVDVVYGVPKGIRQSWWRRVSSRMSKFIMKVTLEFNYAEQTSSFRVFRTRLRDSFSGDLGPGVSLDSLLSWATGRFASVEVNHHERTVGQSNYNSRKLFRFMLDTATGYSTVPLRFATSLGLTTVALSLGVLIWVLGRPLITGESVPGFPFLAATIAIFSGVQLIVLGVLGQYIGRMHFRVMNKPTYTIADRTDRLVE